MNNICGFLIDNTHTIHVVVTFWYWGGGGGGGGGYNVFQIPGCLHPTHFGKPFVHKSM